MINICPLTGGKYGSQNTKNQGGNQEGISGTAPQETNREDHRDRAFQAG